MSRLKIIGCCFLTILLVLSCKKDQQVSPRAGEGQDTTEVSVPEGWKLVWHNVFDESEVDHLKWEF